MPLLYIKWNPNKKKNTSITHLWEKKCLPDSVTTEMNLHCSIAIALYKKISKGRDLINQINLKYDWLLIPTYWASNLQFPTKVQINTCTLKPQRKNHTENKSNLHLTKKKHNFKTVKA